MRYLVLCIHSLWRLGPLCLNAIVNDDIYRCFMEKHMRGTKECVVGIVFCAVSETFLILLLNLSDALNVLRYCILADITPKTALLIVIIAILFIASFITPLLLIKNIRDLMYARRMGI